MKKLFATLLLLLLCLSIPVTAFAAQEKDYVMDGANLLTDSQEAQLRRELAELSATYGAEIAVVTVASTDRNADAYVEYLYDSLNFGTGSSRDGVLLLLCMDLREYRILSNGMAASAISSGDINTISNAIVSDLSSGNYADAFSLYAQFCAYYLDGYLYGFPFQAGRSLGISLVVGLILALIGVLIMKAQLKSVRPQNRAEAYVKKGSLHVTQRRDIFLYRNVTRTPKDSGNSRSSGGSSRNVGGGRF